MSESGSRISEKSLHTPDSSPSRSVIVLYVLLGCALGAVLLRYSWEVASLALMGPLVLAIFLARPDYGLYLFTAAAVVMTELIPGGGASEGAFELMEPELREGVPSLLILTLLLMFVVYVIRLVLIERRLPRAPNRFLSFAVLVVLGAAVTGYARGWSSTEIWVDLKMFLFPLGCLFLYTSILVKPRDIRRLLWVMFAAAFVKSTILVTYYLIGRGVLPAETRVVTYDPADIIVFIAMIGLALALVTGEDLVAWKRLALLASIAPMLFAVVFSFRRAAWIGLVLSLGLMVLWSRPLQRKRLLLVGFSTALVSIGLLTILVLLSVGPEVAQETFEQRFMSIFSLTGESNIHHFREPIAVLIEMGKTPLLGLGLGSKHSFVDSGWRDQPLNYVHNEWLFVWMKLGIAGLLGLGWIAVGYVRRLHRFLGWSETAEFSRSVVLGIGASAGYWYFQSMLDSIVFFRQRVLLMVALGVVVWSITELQRKSTTGSRSA